MHLVTFWVVHSMVEFDSKIPSKFGLPYGAAHKLIVLSRQYRRLTSVRQGLTSIGPPMWRAEGVSELTVTLSALPATAVGQLKLNMAN